MRRHRELAICGGKYVGLEGARALPHHYKQTTKAAARTCWSGRGLSGPFSAGEGLAIGGAGLAAVAEQATRRKRIAPTPMPVLLKSFSKDQMLMSCSGWVVGWVRMEWWAVKGREFKALERGAEQIDRAKSAEKDE